MRPFARTFRGVLAATALLGCAAPTPARAQAKPPSASAGTVLFNRALRAAQAGRLADAEALYRQILAADPRNAGVWANLGLTLARRGRVDAAIDALRRASALDGSTPEFAGQCALIALRAGRNEDAATEARRALAIAPNHIPALSALAGALVAQRRYQAAVAPLRQLDQLRRGKDPRTLQSLVFCLSVAGGRTEALPLARRLVQIAPKDASARVMLGDLAGQIGYEKKDRALLAEARAAYEKAFALNPKDTRAGLNAALAAEMAGAPMQAKAVYTRILKGRPNDPQAHYGLGRVLLSDPTLTEAARAAQARTHFEAAVAQEPRNPDYAIALGFTLAMLGPAEADRAANVLRAALSVSPDNGRARRGLVEVLWKANRREDALAEQKILVEKEPGDYDARKRLVDIHRTLGRDADAWAQLRELARRHPSDTRALKELGLLLEQANRLDEAIAAMEQALARAPKDADALVSLGLILEKAGRTGDARARYEAAVAADPKHESGNAALIALLDARGDAAAALAARERWVETDPASNKARWELALAYQRLKRDDDALAQMRRLILRKDDPLRATYRLAPVSLYEQRERFDDAVAELRRLVAEEPSEEARFRLAENLDRAGKRDEAEREIRSLMEGAKDRVRAQLALAGLHERTNRLDDAARVCEDLVQSHPEVGAAVEGLRRIRTAQGRKADADAFLETVALAGDGPNAALMVAIDRHSIADGAPERYAALTERAVARFPKNRLALALRAQQLLRGRVSDAARAEAAALYGRIAALAPEDSDPPFQQGRLLQAIGRRDEAIAAYRESVRRKRGGPAETALKALGITIPAEKPADPPKKP